MKVSVCITVFNEEKTIIQLLDSLLTQTKKPDEIIIVDGGSKDSTANLVRSYQKKDQRIIIIVKKCSRGEGRNILVNRAKNNIIAMTDAGCVVRDNWLGKITAPFVKKEVDIVAGFYQMTGERAYQKAIAIFLGTMPDRFDDYFLPSTRSIAFRKSAWEKIGGFPEKKINTAEDTEFNYQAVKQGMQYVRVKDSLVEWKMPESFKEGMSKLHAYAQGDALYGIWWHPVQKFSSHNIKALLIIVRYIAGLILFIYAFKFSFLLPIVLVGLGAYMLWVFNKVYTQTKKITVSFWGIIIQFSSDAAVMSGFVAGIFKGGGYFKKTAQGISWMALLRGFIRGMALVKIIILARFLLPSQFGAYGIAMVVFGLFEIVTETGINIALIQEGDDIDGFISTAWVVSVIRGLVIAGVLFLIAPFVAYFFRSPETLDMIRFVSLVPLVRGFINPAIVKFQKKLAFYKEFWFRFSIYFIDTVFAVTIGIILRSAYALMWGMLASAIAEVIISFRTVRPLPVLRFDLDKARKVIGRGKWITLAGVFDYLFQHLDDIAIGKLLGITPLGLYQQAYRISTLSISEVGEIFNKVTFPSYVHIAHDTERLKRAFLTVTMVISLIVIPFGLLLFLFAQDIVLVLFGEKWLGAVSALKVLAIFGILKALSNSAYSLFLSVRKQQIITVITLVGIVGLSLPLVPLIHVFGIVGASYAAILGTLVGFPFTIYYLRRIFAHA